MSKQVRWSTHRLTIGLFVLALLAAACASSPEPDADGQAGPDGTASASPGDGEGGDAEWEAIVEAARDEGPVVFYSSAREPTLADIEKAFNEAYPEIGVETTRFVSGDMVARVDQERSTGAAGADVIATTIPLYLDQVADDGDFTPIVGPNFRQIKQTLYAEHSGNNHPDDMYGIHMAEAMWIMWNTDLVSEPIDDYDDVTARAEEFGNGSFGVTQIYSDQVVHFYLQLEEGIDGRDIATAKEEPMWLAELAALEPTIYESGIPLSNAIAAGEVKAGVLTAPATFQILKDQGAPVEATASECCPYSINMYAGIMKNARNANAAQVFVDWLFSREGQEAVGKGGSMTLLDDIPGATGDISKMPPPPRERLADPDFVAAYRARWDGLFR